MQEGEGGSLEQDFSGVMLFYVLVFNVLHPAAKKITNSCLEAFDEPQLVGSYLVRRLQLDPCKGSQRGGSSSKPPPQAAEFRLGA